MFSEYRAHLENLDIHQFSQLLQKARKTALSVKPSVTDKSRTEKRNPPQALAVSTGESTAGVKCKRDDGAEQQELPPIPCTNEEIKVIVDKWVADGVLRIIKPNREPIKEDKQNSHYCHYYQYVHHKTRDCRALRRIFHKKITDETLDLTREQGAQWNPLPQHNWGRATAAMVIHAGNNEGDMGNSGELTPAAISALQRSPAFRALFNQLGFNEEARKAATEALVSIAFDSGTHCFTAKAHASRTFLETTNAITFTDEDMEVQHHDHSRPLYVAARINDVHIRRALVDTGASLNLVSTSTLQAAEIPLNRITRTPIEVAGFAGMQEHTIGSKQLVLRVGPIVALTRFHVIDSAIPYHALLGRPWLHIHKLVPSTYHQCVKGRFLGKPIRILANHTPFNLSEAHYFEADFYNEFTPCGEDAMSKPIGTPLPD